MAKRQNEEDRDRPARVRYFELEGSDETIQKALSTFERMRNPNPPPTPPARRLPSTTSPADPMLFDEHEPIETESETSGDESSQSDLADRRKRGDGVPIDRNAGITAAGNVDFYPQGKQSLKEFFAEKAPASDMERCLVFCFYMQEILAISPFGVSHVLAGFNNVEKAIPKDLAGTLRNMNEGKKKGKAWLGFTDINNIRVTTNGLNEVRHELGKGGPKSNGTK